MITAPNTVPEPTPSAVTSPGPKGVARGRDARDSSCSRGTFHCLPAILLCTALAACSGGAARSRHAARPVSVAVAVTPIGVTSISTEQTKRVHAALIPELQRAGYSLAQTSAAADLVLLVSFTPTPEGEGGRVKIMGLEPSAQFRRSTDNGDTPEAKEMRRRQRELQQWIDRQLTHPDS